MTRYNKAKSEGQVFLKNKAIARNIVDAANLTKKEYIVEIGPGKGVLTDLLAEQSKMVYAIEKDFSLCTWLKNFIVCQNNIRIVNADALTFSYDRLPASIKIVSNLPYNISTPLLLRLISFSNISSLTVMVQKEVAERITALPGTKQYGRLSIGIQVFAEADYLFLVKKGDFSPVPKVDSAVIQLNRLKKPRIKKTDQKIFFSFVHKAFSQRRKTLKNNFKGVMDSSALEKAFLKTGINPSLRAEAITIEEFYQLSKNIKND